MGTRLSLLGLAVVSLPFVMGAKGGCGGSFSSTDPAPDVSAAWSVAYAPNMKVELKIGGAVYAETLPAEGGSFVVTHGGVPFTFDIDCSRPEIICPSEVWPTQVTVEQRDPTYRHRMWVTIPVQSCSGAMVAPKPSECGAGTLNPDCDPICMGEVKVTPTDTFGLINEPGTAFDLFLGAGVATNGVNCVLLGLSLAHAGLVTTGSATSEPWTATAMKDGTVKAGYAGGCLWAGDPNMDGQTEALVLGASAVFTVDFTANRVQR